MENVKTISGFEESTYSLTDLPIISLGQALSPEVGEGKINQGDLFNTVTKEKLGDLKTPVEIIVYKAWPSRTKFAPRGSKGPKVECSSPDGVRGSKGECKKCPLNNFSLRDRCTEQRSFIVALASAPGALMRLIFSRSNMAVGRKLEKSLIAALNEKKIPHSFGITMLLGSAKEKNDSTNSTYFVFTAEVGKVIPEDQRDELLGYANEAAELRAENLARFTERLESGEGFGDATEEGTTEGGDAEGAGDNGDPGDALV